MDYFLIPSAKCAPDNLPNYGFVPMILYPVNGHTLLHYLFKEKCKTIIVGYEQVKLIEEHLKKKKYKDVNLISLNSIKDLGYSIYCALKTLFFTDKDAIIINFADTLVDINSFDYDYISYTDQSRGDTKKWAYINEHNGRIISYINKDEVNDSGLKLFVGNFRINHPNFFVECFKNLKFDGNSLFDALKSYSQKYPFKFVKVNKWLDFGHPSDYFDSQISVKAREFNHISFDKNRGILRKTSDDKEKFKGEIEWYLKLPNSLKYVSPRIFNYSIDFNNIFVDMEFYSYPTLLELYLYGDLSNYEWKKIFDKILFILKDFSSYTVTNCKIKDSLIDMYYTKTVDRLNMMRDIKQFKKFFEKNIVVNNKQFLNLDKIIKIMKSVVNDNLLNAKEFCIIHGDMCFANMLIDDKHNFLKLIDPRGKFGDFDIYGDQRYEIAKLFHSVDGKYDYIIKDLFEISVVDNSINYRIFDSHNSSLFDIMKISLNDIIKEHIAEIEIIEALLFLSMIPLHSENINHQYAMLATGLEILNRHINIEIKGGSKND